MHGNVKAEEFAKFSFLINSDANI